MINVRDRMPLQVRFLTTSDEDDKENSASPAVLECVALNLRKWFVVLLPTSEVFILKWQIKLTEPTVCLSVFDGWITTSCLSVFDAVWRRHYDVL